MLRESMEAHKRKAAPKIRKDWEVSEWDLDWVSC